jgi:hypothetical protein
MADTIAVTAGSGTTIATDDCAGVHYQKVKLIDGTADSTAVIPGDATNGLYVNVTKNVPGTGATNLGKAEDAAHSSGDTGVFVLSVRDDAPASTAGAEADYAALLTDSTGRLHTNSTINSDSVMTAGVANTPLFAVIDAATSGDNTLIAAVTSKKIRVLSLFLVSAGTVNVRFESGASGTALTGQMNLVANTGFVLPFNPCGWFETGSNTLLNLELSGAVSVDGSITYITTL